MGFQSKVNYIPTMILYTYTYRYMRVHQNQNTLIIGVSIELISTVITGLALKKNLLRVVVVGVLLLKKNLNASKPSEHPPQVEEFLDKTLSSLFTSKTVLTSIQYLLFLTLQGKETNFRGHKLTQNKVQKNKNKIKKTQRKSQHLREKANK